MSLLSSDSSPDALSATLRELVLPLHQFDSKWRSITPCKLTLDDTADQPAGLTKVPEDERRRLFAAHVDWVRAEQLRQADSTSQDERARQEMDEASLLRPGQNTGGLGRGIAGGVDESMNVAAETSVELVAAAPFASEAAVVWTQAAQQSTQEWIAELELLE